MSDGELDPKPQMSPEELAEALETLHWTQAELSRRLGVHKNTVGDWMSEKYPIPGYARAYVTLALWAHKIRTEVRSLMKPTKPD